MPRASSLQLTAGGSSTKLRRGASEHFERTTSAMLLAVHGAATTGACRNAVPREKIKERFEARMREHAAIADAVDAIVTVNEVSRGKPSADLWLEAARRLRVDPTRCLAFDEGPAGIAGAQAAGAYRASHNMSSCAFFQHSASHPIWGCICCMDDAPDGRAHSVWSVYRTAPDVSYVAPLLEHEPQLTPRLVFADRS